MTDAADNPATPPAGATLVHHGELRESADNPRTISDEKFAALCYALEKAPKMMMARPCIGTLDGEVVGGNMRLRAAKSLIARAAESGEPNGYTIEYGELVPAYLRDFTPSERFEWALRDNVPYGQWEEELLAEQIGSYRQDEDADEALTGFLSEELDALVRQAAGAGEGNGSGDTPPDLWGVVVECDTETTQRDLLERLEGEGYTCRALL